MTVLATLWGARTRSVHQGSHPAAPPLAADLSPRLLTSPLLAMLYLSPPLFRHLAGKGVRVVTSNAGAIGELQGSDAEVIVIGGTYRAQSHSFVGPLALLALQRIYASRCFIGVDGISLKCGLTTPSLEEAEIARTMIEHTQGEVVIIADHTKVGAVADCVTAPLDRVDTIVVDSGLDAGYRVDLESQGIQIVLAEVQQSDDVSRPPG